MRHLGFWLATISIIGVASGLSFVLGFYLTWLIAVN